jgi:hypothetical protein
LTVWRQERVFDEEEGKRKITKNATKEQKRFSG